MTAIVTRFVLKEYLDIKARNTNQNTLQCLIAGVLILGVLLEAQMSEKVLNKDFNFLGIKNTT